MTWGRVEWRSFLAILVLFLGSVSPALAQSRQELMEAAKREGRFVWYTSMSLDDSQPLLQAFEKKYPPLKGEIYRASGEKLLNKAMTEARAGQILFDVFSNSGFEVHLAQKANLLSPYRSPEARGYREGFRHPEGFWTDLYDNYYVIGYNTKLVRPEEVPRRWEDLLHPRWKGNVALDEEEFEWYGAMLLAWGEERGRRFMKALAAQEPLLRKGHTLIAQLLSAGEFPLGLVYAHRIEELKRMGAPVGWVTTTDPIVAGMRPIALSARPRSPNAAKLFIDFVLSAEGQAILRELDRIAARPEIGFRNPAIDKSALRLFPVSPALADRFEAIAAEFRALFAQ